MVDVSRRLFLGGALALAGAKILEQTAAAESSGIPTLYGDGVHDDTVALQALFDRKPVRIEGQIVADVQEGMLQGGDFVISDTIHIRTPGWLIRDVRLSWKAPRLLDSGPMLQVHSDGNALNNFMVGYG